MTYHNRIINRELKGQNPLGIELAIHPASNGVIVINLPGITGNIQGYNDKYVQLADLIQEKGIGTVVRMGNPYFPELPYPEGMIDNFKFGVDYANQNSQELSGSATAKLYLMGASAGAGVIAATAADFPNLEKILLISPAADAGEDRIEEGLKKFKGEVYITIGQEDDMVGPETGQFFYDLAISAKIRKLEFVPNCDHQFRGEINGRVLSKAPLWAFRGDTTFPSPEGGKKLY